MRIGILTLPQETNYGGILQAFALQKVLRDMGHEVLTIDRHNRRQYPSLKIHIAGYAKRLMQHYLQGKAITTKWNPFQSDADYAEVSVQTQRFIDRNIRMTRRFFSDQLKEIEDEYQFDAYVVGSDQVWLDSYCPNSFLDFVRRPEVVKVVYAASCGKRSFFNSPSKVGICRKLCGQFSGISVREQSLVHLCKEKLGIDAQWVLDPTMLLTPSDYLAATDNKVGDEPIVFSYILDATPEKTALINKVAQQLGLKVVDGNRTQEDVNAGRPFPSVDDWIHNLNRARFVVTDSFHGTVFSILFNKQFLTVSNAARGKARFSSLLGLFGLEERLMEDELSGVTRIMNSPIDYQHVNIILENAHEKSTQFLKQSLKQ